MLRPTRHARGQPEAPQRCGKARRSAQRIGRGSCAALLAGALAACAARSPESGGLSQGEAAGAAVVTALAAGTLWIATGGCRLQGCPYGSYCNQETGYCDVRKCQDGCPDGTICNEGLGRCQAPPPPKVPNDFLPQDDARNPPGTN